MFEIEKNVPMSHGNAIYPFEKMDVGDSFVVPASFVAKVRAAASFHGKRHGRKFSVRHVGDDQCRCWRVE
ncbi:hypothetical protein [Bordetella genomosp. 7]|uniref:DUF7303 family protein n=1 Tax=Bordetella genomosp. 7 TaxID=1416805 RepID=UPI000B9E7735|nr:hypothetical protein [Bordetella genomosp. 7]